ncbi:hypothetical protein JCM33374_g4121 [Metschnikowia sp. JCM 33374]|nr:hypothetical protein JCM33374_g4121 [Metschnikowia sp. JCM 33374]
MDRINPLDIPLNPVTKTWVCAIGALAAMTSMNWVSIVKLVFSPARVFSEPWRLITSFCYFGDLQVLLIQNIVVIAQTNDPLEAMYLYKIEYMPHAWVQFLDKDSKAKLREEIEARKTYDFAHFMARIAVSIVATVVCLSRWVDVSREFLLLGPVLEKVILYILCRNTPSEYISFMGISIMAKYLPFLTHFIEFLFSKEFQKFSLTFHQGMFRAMGEFLTSGLVKQSLIVLTISHFWWYIQFFYLEYVDVGFSTSTQEEWSKAYTAIRKNRSVWLDLPNFYRYLITPPWYYFVTRRLLKRQEIIERLIREGNFEAPEEEENRSREGPSEPTEAVEQNVFEAINPIEGSSGISRAENEVLE